MGDPAMKSIVRFNIDNYLLSLNAFEVISTFDHVEQASKGIKAKLTQIDKLNDGIERRQRRLDTNVDDMAAKLRTFRDLKREVDNMNQY